MPLSAPVPREEVHTRTLEIKGYSRADGLWDIEGHLTDRKPFSYQMFERSLAPDEPVHDMWLRLTLDLDFLVHAAEAWTESSPYESCPLVAPDFRALAGLKIGPGWTRKVKERLGGRHGCTHLVEMLGQMATTAYQALWSEQARRKGEVDRPSPDLIDSCYAYRRDGPLVARVMPEHAEPPTER